MRPRHGRGATPAGMIAQLFVTTTEDETALVDGPARIRTRDQRIMSLLLRREPPRTDETFPCLGHRFRVTGFDWSRPVSALLFPTCLPRLRALAQGDRSDGRCRTRCHARNCEAHRPPAPACRAREA